MEEKKHNFLTRRAKRIPVIPKDNRDQFIEVIKKMTLKELHILGRSEKLKYYYTMSKADIQDLLLKHYDDPTILLSYAGWKSMALQTIRKSKVYQQKIKEEEGCDVTGPSSKRIKMDNKEYYTIPGSSFKSCLNMLYEATIYPTPTVRDDIDFFLKENEEELNKYLTSRVDQDHRVKWFYVIDAIFQDLQCTTTNKQQLKSPALILTDQFNIEEQLESSRDHIHDLVEAIKRRGSGEHLKLINYLKLCVAVYQPLKMFNVNNNFEDE